MNINTIIVLEQGIREIFGVKKGGVAEG